TITGWNRAAEILYGHARDVALGRPALDVLFDADDRDAARSLLERVIAGEPWDGDFRVRREDGVLLVSSFRAAPVDGANGVVWIGRTILGRQVELTAGDGTTRHLSISYYPVRSTTGARVGAGASVVDVTEAKRAEVERAALLRQAETAQQRLAILATASTVL